MDATCSIVGSNNKVITTVKSNRVNPTNPRILGAENTAVQSDLPIIVYTVKQNYIVLKRKVNVTK